MSEHEHWQLDGSAPELYERYLVPAITSLWAADLLERVRPNPGDAVIDIACGTGVVIRLAAARMAKGHLVGLDFNAGMLAVARTIPNAGAPIEWIEGSALSLPFGDRSFDLALCQLGLQFFPDRSLALREMYRVLAKSGRVALSVFSAIERTPVASAFARALDQSLGPDASKIKRAEHIFREADQVRTLLANEGFVQIEVNTVTQHISFPSVLDYVRFQLTATPIASLLSHRNQIERESTIKEVASITQSLLGPELLRDGRLTSPQEGHVATARRVD
ncbi:MAG TPA: class I SAM-dependent methyltransferase [Aestuariivirga sp.]|jgi:ubiquinone/menaquinone biosynthesis C-methylase UbiE